LKDYFNRQSGVDTMLIVRGGKEVELAMLAARRESAW